MQRKVSNMIISNNYRVFPTRIFIDAPLAFAFACRKSTRNISRGGQKESKLFIRATIFENGKKNILRLF